MVPRPDPDRPAATAALVYILARWFLFVPIAIFEKTAGVTPLRRSTELVRGELGQMVPIVLAAGAGTFGVSLVATFGFGIVGAFLPCVPHFLILVFDGLAFGFFCSVSMTSYYALKRKKAGSPRR